MEYGVIKSKQDVYEDPQPGDVLVIASNRIDAHERGRAPGSTVVVRFRARAMWARIIEMVPGEGHRVELIAPANEPPAAPDAPR